MSERAQAILGFIGTALLALALLVWALWPMPARAETPYDATVTRVVDGDTVRVLVVVWERTMVDATIRLAGVNAPELRAQSACERQAAREAKAFAERFLAGGRVKATIAGREKFGRSLGRLSVDGRDLGEALVQAGLARPYSGGRRGPWC